MARPVLTVDASGAAGASLAETVEGLNERQREAFGADLAATPQTPQAQWAGIAGLGLTEVGEAGARAAVYGSSVDHAVGVHLDAIGSVADVRRLEATHSRVVATLTGVGGVTVPAGSRAKTEDGDEFETVAAAVLLDTGVNVVMQAVVAGPVAAPAGELNRIVTGIEGWESVTNAEAATLGRARQDDDEYKRVYRARTAHSSVGPMDGLKGALTEAGGERVVVRDNPTNAAAVDQLWTLPAHGILAIVEGGLNADIQRAVENHRGMGVSTLTAIIGGPLPSGGGVTAATVTAGGSGYDQDTTTVAFSGGGATRDATGTVTVTSGVVTAITITDGGAGYTSAPTVTITDTGSGTGAAATATVSNGYLAGLTSPYEVEWRGTTVTISDSDWTGASTNADRAAVITTAIDSDVTVAWTGFRFIGQYEWKPDDTTAEFGDDDISVALGLNPDDVTVGLTGDPVAIPSPGPYIRPISRPLTVTLTLDRRTLFPGDGLERVISAVLARVGGTDAIADRDLTDDAREQIREQLTLIGAQDGYALGEQAWSNDILGAAERVPGTRITALTVQSGGADVSGVAVDLANRWTLAADDLSITVA